MKKFIFSTIAMLFICTCCRAMDIRQKQVPHVPKFYVIDEETLTFLAGQRNAEQRKNYLETCEARDLFSAPQPELMSPEVVTFIKQLKKVGYTEAEPCDSTDRSPLVVVGELDDRHSYEIWQTLLRLKNLRQQQIKPNCRPFESLPVSVEVGLRDQKQISLWSTECTKKFIFINGLNGFCALAMIIKCKSGAQHVIMSQFPSGETQVEELKEAIMQISGDEIIRKTLIVLTGGKITKVSDTRYQFTPTSEFLRHINLLKDAVQVTPSAFTYFESDNYKAKNDPDFRVELSKDQVKWSFIGDSHKLHSIY